MAGRSRKQLQLSNSAAPKAASENKVFLAGIYARLSVEDPDQSNESINNQIALAKKHIRQFPDLKLIEIYSDSGATGTNFDRADFQRLILDIQKKKINCIVVKDFSRFGRDYIETGDYLEKIFPFLGVRFISVTDHYDSKDFMGKLPQLDTTFQHLVNDLYVKDISIKVKSSLDTRRESGIYANGSTPFGYQKSPKDCHLLTPVEPEAEIVRRIFQMTLDGYSSSQIARQFNAEGVRTPIEYKMARGIAARKPKGNNFLWDGSTICQMLRNDFYAGDLVYGKYETVSAGGKTRLKPREEWKIYRNHHEAIIDRSTYELVQQSRGKIKHPQNRKRKKHPLTGKMVCGHCRKSLKISPSANPYFFCPTRYQIDSSPCSAQINAMHMEQLILYLLQQEIMKQMDQKELQEVYITALQKKYGMILREKDRLLREKTQLQKEKLRTYEQYRHQSFTRDQYLEIQKPLQDKEASLLLAIAKQEKKLRDTEDDMVKQNWELTKLDQLTADIMIGQIRVWDENHMELLWNFCMP